MQENINSKHGIPFGWHLQCQRMVKADQVVKGRACKCVCVACGVSLIARQGAIRTWHFAHGADANCQHATEAAIHRMAKQLIVERGSIFVPQRELSRVIHGERQVWEETLTLVVQSAGLQTIAGCELEKTVGLSTSDGEFRRPDVIGLLEGHQLAIEILNTHAVDQEKLLWLKERMCSVLEIDVGDIALLPPDQLQAALEARLFQNAEYSAWLTHANDEEAEKTLDEMEAETRQAWLAEEQVLLAKLEAEEDYRKRREEYRKRIRDIEDFKIRFGRATVRVGRNEQRVSLKVFGYASSEVFDGAKTVARRNTGRFNTRAKCWEFFRHSGTKPFFNQLCTEVEAECLERLYGGTALPSPPTQIAPTYPQPPQEKQLPIYFSDPAFQEHFDERTGILEYEAGIEHNLAEQIAKEEVVAALDPDETGGCYGTELGSCHSAGTSIEGQQNDVLLT